MLFLLPGIILSVQFLFLGCRSQFGKRWVWINESQPAVIGHLSDVQENLITAEVWQGSLKGGDCADMRSEEQHEKGKLLLAMFLWDKWSCNRSSRPVRKRWNWKGAANRTAAFARQLSTFLVPETACDLSQNGNWLDLTWGGNRDHPEYAGRPYGDSLL